MNIWDIVFLQPLLNGLILFYKLSGNLGIAIIAFTIFIRLFLIPLTLPSMKVAQKMKELAPYLERLKLRHGDDRAKLAQAQMELYRQHGVNPAAGCLPQIVQIIILIALFQVFFKFLSADSLVISKINEFLWSPLKLAADTEISKRFLYLDLTHPDVFPITGFPFPLPGLFLILSAAAQFVSSKMMLPARPAVSADRQAGGPTVSKEAREAQKTKTQTDDLMLSLQQSMLWTFPLMTLVIGFAFPSVLVLYWFVFSLFQVVQQYFVSGWGGLGSWIPKKLTS